MDIASKASQHFSDTISNAAHVMPVHWGGICSFSPTCEAVVR
jgi:hypothetical protein